MISKEFCDEVCFFLKKKLKIKSKVLVSHKHSKLNSYDNSQQMAGVSFPIGGVFHIVVNYGESEFGFVRRLAHEYVHVKQIEDKRLVKISPVSFSFDKEVFNYSDYEDNYHGNEIPAFEEEAFEKERILANLFWKERQ